MSAERRLWFKAMLLHAAISFLHLQQQQQERWIGGGGWGAGEEEQDTLCSAFHAPFANVC